MNQPVGWLWREFEDGQRWRALAVQARVFQQDESKRATLSSGDHRGLRALVVRASTSAWAARYARDKERVKEEYREVEAISSGGRVKKAAPGLPPPHPAG